MSIAIIENVIVHRYCDQENFNWIDSITHGDLSSMFIDCTNNCDGAQYFTKPVPQ